MDNFISPTKIKELNNEYDILHLVYHRNKNQHRQSIWWKYLNILHRYIRKILKLTLDIERITSKSSIKHKKEQIIEIVRYLISKKIFRKAYFEFNGIITLGQFIGLGLTLVGLLSKIYDILVSIGGVKKMIEASKSTDEVDKDFCIISDELGEAITNTDIKEGADISRVEPDAKKSESEEIIRGKRKSASIDDIFDMLPTKKSKKVKKKKKNDIDDIFG